jgi:3-methylcrotonyl-CoA carboxylase beta subunit
MWHLLLSQEHAACQDSAPTAVAYCGLMPVLSSQVDASSSEFLANRSHMDGLEAELKARLAAARAGGGDEAQRRQREQGKLPVRERVERLLDPGTPFLEIAALAADEALRRSGAGGRARHGHRPRQRSRVMVVANDPSVKGGTYFPSR